MFSKKMINISLENIPDWANWAAFDEDGTLCWFENEPFILESLGIWNSNGKWKPEIVGDEKFGSFYNDKKISEGKIDWKTTKRKIEKI